MTGLHGPRAHRWDSIAAERRDEITLACACGLVWKHLPLKLGMTAQIPPCPDTQPTDPHTGHTNGSE
jgi:hypothetical protein